MSIGKKINGLGKKVTGLGKEITKIQKMVKCPISITSNIQICAPIYLLDAIAYVIYAIVTLFRLPWVAMLNVIILALNWAIMPTFRFIINFVMGMIMRPEWKINGSLTIPYINPWIAHKNDVIRYVNIVFPFFNRTPHMRKCYCASSLRWVLQPLTTPTQSWTKWFLQLFSPFIAAAQWMVQVYKKTFGTKDDVAASMTPMYLTLACAVLFTSIFLWVHQTKT